MMISKQSDTRSEERKCQDEEIAAESQLPPPDISGKQPRPVEAFLGKRRQRPLAVFGIAENGLVRPLDPQVKLPEQSRVIIVATESV